MNKNLVTWSDYETPSVKTLDILSEGVLCASGVDTASYGYVFENELGEI